MLSESHTSRVSSTSTSSSSSSKVPKTTPGQQTKGKKGKGGGGSASKEAPVDVVEGEGEEEMEAGGGGIAGSERRLMTVADYHGELTNLKIEFSSSSRLLETYHLDLSEINDFILEKSHLIIKYENDLDTKKEIEKHLNKVLINY
jgi:hypothetical protein